MKTTKRVLAIVLAALMLACMIPFAVSAATAPAANVDIKLSCSTPGYKFTIYRLATLDTEKGLYTVTTTDATVAADIKAGVQDSDKAQFLADCNAAAESTLGAAVDVYNTNPATAETNPGQGASYSKTVPAGIYYIKVKDGDAPATNTSVTNSVFSLPYYNGTDWVNDLGTINLAAKVADETPTIDKTVKKSTDTDWKEAISEDYGKEFQFKIVAKVAGSASQKVNAYRIVDTQATGLSYVRVDSVKLIANQTATTGTDLDGKYAVKTTGLPAGSTFGVEITDIDSLYTTANAYVEVIYTAKVNENAAIAAVNHNDAKLQWQPKGTSTWTDGPNDGADVYTYEIKVVKVDAAHESTKLAGAEFKVYASAADAANTTEDKSIATATTGDGENGTTLGEAFFMKDGKKYTFAAGTYYVKETKAPDGYNLSTEVITVEISSDTATATSKTVTVKDSKSVLPNTGGEGTMVFTIVGISLILAAGVLFVLVMRKRSSK